MNEEWKRTLDKADRIILYSRIMLYSFYVLGVLLFVVKWYFILNGEYHIDSRGPLTVIAKWVTINIEDNKFIFSMAIILEISLVVFVITRWTKRSKYAQQVDAGKADPKSEDLGSGSRL